MIYTHTRFKRTLFIRTRQKQQTFGVVPFVKLQNDTSTAAKRSKMIPPKKKKKMKWTAKSPICFLVELRCFSVQFVWILFQNAGSLLLLLFFNQFFCWHSVVFIYSTNKNLSDCDDVCFLDPRSRRPGRRFQRILYLFTGWGEGCQLPVPPPSPSNWKLSVGWLASLTWWVTYSELRFPAPSSKLCQNWLRHVWLV